MRQITEVVFTVLFSLMSLKILLFFLEGIIRQIQELRRHLGYRSAPTPSKRWIPFLLKLILPCDEEQENIIGDLLEECEQFSSKVLAYIWLSRQVIKSLLPLTYKTIKARLISRFREWIR